MGIISGKMLHHTQHKCGFIASLSKKDIQHNDDQHEHQESLCWVLHFIIVMLSDLAQHENLSTELFGQMPAYSCDKLTKCRSANERNTKSKVNCPFSSCLTKSCIDKYSTTNEKQKQFQQFQKIFFRSEYFFIFLVSACGFFTFIINWSSTKEPPLFSALKLLLFISDAADKIS